MEKSDDEKLGGTENSKRRVVKPESNVFAKGVHKPSKETKEKLDDLREKVAASTNLQSLANSSSLIHAAKERREILQKDDSKPILSNLSDRQQRALQKRRQQRSKAHAARMEKHEIRRLEAAVAAANAQEILETTQPGMIEAENDMDKTYHLTQTVLKREHLDTETARNIYDLTLTETAPYGMKYDRSGRYSVLYGEKGHVALMDNRQQSLFTEFNVRERVRDACFLHNFTLFAVAQKNHAFIYDQNGTEIHRLGDAVEPLALDFLPYHWLLVSLGRRGVIRYQDTSTGQAVSSHRTLVPNTVLRQNPGNAVMHVGHVNGTVTLWSPSCSQYLVKMLCHKGAGITSMAIDQSGQTMVTGALDRNIRIWDLRMYKERFFYQCTAGVPTSLDFSQRGLLAVGHAGHVTIWPSEAMHTHVKAPYMHQLYPRCSPIETVRFRPFEDVCGVGHARGVSSMVIPGSGEPQIDTTEHHLNPVADVQQRREEEIRALLDKLQPDTIALDPDQVGGIEPSDHHSKLERLYDLQELADANAKPAKKARTARRGQSKIQVKLRQKSRNVIQNTRKKLQEAQAAESRDKKTKDNSNDTDGDAPAALKRFFK